MPEDVCDHTLTSAARLDSNENYEIHKKNSKRTYMFSCMIKKFPTVNFWSAVEISCCYWNIQLSIESWSAVIILLINNFLYNSQWYFNDVIWSPPINYKDCEFYTCILGYCAQGFISVRSSIATRKAEELWFGC